MSDDSKSLGTISALYKNVVRQISDLTAENARMSIRDKQVLAVLRQFHEKGTGYNYSDTLKLVESLNALYHDDLVKRALVDEKANKHLANSKDQTHG